MKIHFLVNEIHNGWTPLDKRLGGTEESIVEWARLLSKDHEVIVYGNGFRGSVGKVKYLNRKDYSGGGDICINIKSSEVDPLEPTLYLTNETDATDKDLSKYLGVIWPSQWAVDNIPVNNKTFILPHGYDDQEIYPGKKIPKQCLYASSPDRGLFWLLRAWPSVIKAHPDATLIVTYGGEKYDVDGATFVDASVEEMNKLYRESDIWAYPCNGGELYCMTGIKAQAAACIPVIIPTMALSETVKHAYQANGPSNFAAKLIRAMDDVYVPGYAQRRNTVMRNRMAKEHYPNWQDSTDKLLAIIKEVL